MTSLLDSFDKVFAGPVEGQAKTAMSIVTFAKRWCLMDLTLAQRVILKLYAGEELSRYVQVPYRTSEQGWFDMMYRRGRFPRNVYDRITDRQGKGFQNILLAVGRRGGKSTMIAVAALYSVYKVLLHDNPHTYYNIQQSDTISVAVTATSQEQANRSPFAKIDQICRNAIAEGTPLADWIREDGIKQKTIYFETVHDRKTNIALKRKRSTKRTASVQIESYNSNIDSFRGGAVIAAILDEFAQFPITNKGEDTAEYFHSTLTASIPQFKGDGRVFILSTPQGKVGKFWDIYNDVWDGSSKATIGVRMPSWEAWEAEPFERRIITLEGLSEDDNVPFSWDPYEHTIEEALERSPASFKREFAAEFEGSEDQWIPSFYLTTKDPDSGIFRPRLKHKARGAVGRIYAVAVDPARTNDAFAVVVAHKEIIEEREVVVVDQAVRWFVQPTPTYEARDFEFVVRQEGAQPAFIHTQDPVKYLKEDVLGKFNVGAMFFDQGGGPMIVDELATEAQRRQMIYTQIRMVPATAKRNYELSDLFEQLVLEDRIICYEHEVLQEELLGLIKDPKGRVMNGPGTHDDLYDALSNACKMVLEMPTTVGGSQGGFRGRSFSLDPVVAQGRL